MKPQGLRFFSVAAIVASLLLTGCERPPIETKQVGYRGTGMVLVNNPRAPKTQITIPAAQPPAAPGGPRASAIYQNVQVLGDLGVAEFTRTMLAITAWVAPEQGCNYCHSPQNLASDDLYTKVVSRRMLQMTRDLNANWSAHIGETGVTCYTCHVGNNVPEYIWFASNEVPAMAAYAGNRAGQNAPGKSVGLSSLPLDPFSRYLTNDQLGDISVVSASWAPSGNVGSIQDTEATYGLMFHLSEALGVNCNFCHNSRAFASWEQSTPQRVTAWHGLRMVAQINNDYLTPLGPTYPENRLGPLGDAPKANCATCHQGANKPLGGVRMVKDYPALQSN